MNFTINNHEYSTVKMLVLDQLHLTRRLAPALGALVKGVGPDGLKAMMAAANESEDANTARALEVMTLGLDALAGMSESDVNWVTLTCLQYVQIRGDAGIFAFVAVRGTIVRDDLELPELMQIVGKVIQENLGNFFRQRGTLGSAPAPQNPTSSGAPTPTTTT